MQASTIAMASRRTAADKPALMPIGLLVLAAGRLVGAINFFRLRWKRSVTGSGQRRRARAGASTPIVTDDTRTANRP